MLRPVYRWKSFWLGVVVMVFLAWAVLDSFTYRRSVVGMGGQVRFEQVQGGMRVMWEQPVDLAKWKEWWVWEAERWEISPTDDPDPLRVALMRFYNGYRVFSVPLWLVLMLFPVVWGGFLAWRMKKSERVMVDEVEVER